MSKIDWEKISMGIITEAGVAKSLAMEAIFHAKKGQMKEADAKLDEANKTIGKASHLHFEVIQEEAKGNQLEFKVLFLHAEDQLLTTQTLILLAKEFVDVYKKMK